jgi:hypothetical protein
MIRDSPERFAAATSGFASKRQLLFSSAAVCADDLIIGSSVLDFHSLNSGQFATWNGSTGTD